MEKYCPRCETYLDTSQFTKNEKRSDGLQAYCSEHMKEYRREHYKNNPAAYRQRARESTKRKTKFIRDAKDKPCTDCKSEYPYYVMQFDHLEDKKFNLSRMANRCTWEQIKKEIEKCEVVCANCHAERTHGR